LVHDHWVDVVEAGIRPDAEAAVLIGRYRKAEPTAST
jgi:hypothetical protein